MNTDTSPSGVTSPSSVLELASGYAAPLMIETAVRVGLFDALDEKPLDVAALAAKTKTSTRGMRALADGLGCFKVLGRQGELFTLTDVTRTFLVSTKPAYLGRYFTHTTRMVLPWLKLTEAVVSGKPVAPITKEQDGAGFFSDFVESLFVLNYPAAATLAKTLLEREPRIGKVLDVAAGSGVWGIPFAQQSRDLRVTALDWPDVVQVTRRIVERNGVSDRYTFVGGDLRRDDFGQGYDVALLGHCLHNEGVAGCKALLSKVFNALQRGGTVAVADLVPNDERTGPPGALIFAVNMLLRTEEGNTHTFAELKEWLGAAGFRDIRTLEAPAPAPLLLATKP